MTEDLAGRSSMSVAPRRGSRGAGSWASIRFQRERDVLVELCRPLLGGDLFCEPASPRRIAEVLVVSEDAVKKHLARLYDKFVIAEGAERRRVRLANAALGRGAVSLADLRA
jgi:hypothetical protein